MKLTRDQIQRLETLSLMEGNFKVSFGDYIGKEMNDEFKDFVERVESKLIDGKPNK